MNGAILILVILIGGIIGFKNDILVEKIIQFKEKQKEKKYERYSINYLWIDILFAIILGISFGLSFHFYEGFRIAATMVLALLAVLGMRIDQKIRIIPNEIVLVVFLIGLFNQLLTKGIKGILSGIIALFITAFIFFLSGFITSKLSGSIGVGAGDIKLAMAISMYAGMDNIFVFLYSIAIFLVAYLLFRFMMRTLVVGSTFPMGTQIMGGLIVMIYGKYLLVIVEKIMLYII